MHKKEPTLNDIIAEPTIEVRNPRERPSEKYMLCYSTRPIIVSRIENPELFKRRSPVLMTSID